MQTVLPFIAVTDDRWFRFLKGEASGGRVDEVNFWSPRSVRKIKAFAPGEPVFFRLKRGFDAIAGYGFFAHHTVIGLAAAWDVFGWRNGEPDEVTFLGRIGEYRGEDLLDPRHRSDPIACTILRDARFWPRDQWIPWGVDQGWAKNIVQGKTERDPVRAELLRGAITADHSYDETCAEYREQFEVLDFDARRWRVAETVVREGQGTFRTRILDAYGRRCAITGERTEPVLDAAHIQPYLGPPSNHVQNGLLLTKEFHALFDEGLVGVTPDGFVKVSRALRQRWQNGRRYYDYDGKSLAKLPDDPRHRPSEEALEWHMRARFLA